MGNMSYCRFSNTLADLRDCRDALAERCDPLPELSESERKAAEKLLLLCRELADDFSTDLELIDARRKRTLEVR